MLHRISFENFQSFLERTEIDFTVTDKMSSSNWITSCATGARLSKIAAVIGPNGSGKTALLKAVTFLHWFVTSSFSANPEDKIQFASHFAATNKPSTFSAEMSLDGDLWRYELRCSEYRVQYEALYKKHERFRYVFTREWDEQTQSYNVKQNEFGMLPSEAKKVRPNASLISTAAQYNVPLAKRIAGASVFSNVNVLGRIPANQFLVNAATHYKNFPDQFDKMRTLLKSWDLGLDDIEVRELKGTDTTGNTNVFYLPFGKHRCGEITAELPFMLESTGTQSAFVLLSHLLQALASGGLAVIDEFESDLHPHMLEPIITLFAHPVYNPHNAQLLFTCHAMEVLNIVHKSQVILVEKDENCQSTSCRLDKIVKHVRTNENYYAKYMAGAYGAVPQF
ncbi:hypothetical protein FHW67_003126 [Herbaspirillum sp. Sphag1AN]|uniref:AAA family ATPase n=1 Tax=unclassified Herbaspirillum TaxID=2624150 RepID=UPI0016169268|nr:MULTISPECIES: ATP-binding protein [unclassified Herbaspirillum]MBB3213825.1 hypothetical protein [Herbaspirillum sp. Sphag1AN]MBB3247022.1 hypothetical protein [Herbaspirillum sp. Sphag64]